MKNIAPKKSLGQNFLIDESISQKIVDSLELKDDDIVIEIGPGTGALTKYILTNDIKLKLFAIEIDKRAIQDLNIKFEKYISNEKFEIIENDITKLDLENFVKSISNNNQKIKIVGNLPYYITGMILDLILKNSNYFSMFVFMVQKEVADRILASNNSREFSLLTLAVNLYGSPQKVTNVKPGAFFPAPKVNSTVVKISFYENHDLQFQNIEKLMKMAKIAFGQRRKMISNTLKNYFETKTNKKLNEIFVNDINLNNLLNKRPEAISTKEFIELFNFVNK